MIIPRTPLGVLVVVKEEMFNAQCSIFNEQRVREWGKITELFASLWAGYWTIAE